jgi:hypothetical protein
MLLAQLLLGLWKIELKVRYWLISSQAFFVLPRPLREPKKEL